MRRTEANGLARWLLAAALALACVAAPAAAQLPGLPPPGPPSQPPPAPEPNDLAGPAPSAYAGPEGRVSIAHGWSYRADPDDAGLRERWFERPFGGDAVELPHSPNAWPVTGRTAAVAWRGSVGWYRREIAVPEDGRYAIRFESAHHRVRAWIDGRPAGSHTGAYLPFELRPALARGRHVLVVRVDWRDPVAMKRTGWHRAWFNYGGLHREVTLRRLAGVEVLAPSVSTRLEPGVARVRISVRVRNVAPARRRVPVSGRLGRVGRDLPFRMRTVELASGESAIVTRDVAIRDPVLWSPASPALWELRVAAGDGAWRARVGLRELRVRRGRILLNGAPLVMRGASLHEDAPPRGDALRPADQDRLVAQLRALGANATRAQHPLDPGLLERLDAAGVLVWLGIGPFDSPGQWTSNTAAERRAARERVVASLEQLASHPSVAVWSLANEVAWNGRPGGQAQYVDWAARTLRARDPGRLVGLDVWGYRAPARPGVLYRRLDVVGMTNYVGWYEAPYASDAAVARLTRRRVERMRRSFPRKALVVTEFGAEGNDRNDAGRHGSFEYQQRLLASHLRAYRRLPDVSGYLIWNLTDFPVQPAYAGGSISSKVPGIRLRRGLNQKGLFRFDGAPKPATEPVRSVFTRAR